MAGDLSNCLSKWITITLQMAGRKWGQAVVLMFYATNFYQVSFYFEGATGTQKETGSSATISGGPRATITVSSPYWRKTVPVF